MKHARVGSWSAAGTLMVLAGLVASATFAHKPDVVITGPSGTVEVNSFPANVTISFDVTHDTGLAAIQVADLEVNNVQIAHAGNPFTASACTANAIANYTSCSVTGNTGSLGKTFSVPAPGTYAVTAVARHLGLEDDDQQQFDVILLSVEYPAPPSVANKFINQTYGKMTSGCRGQIISTIAENHAKQSKYGPKGGPYNNTLIQQDVAAYKAAFGC